MEAFTAEGYGLAREVLQRGVAAIYLLAFVAVIHQWRPLLGTDGLTPVPRFVARVPWRRAPSLFQWRYSDRLAVGLGWVGAVLAVSALAGLPQRGGTVPTIVVFAVLWLLYLSFVNVGQIWYAFGWESILLEAGFLVMFLGGHDTPVPWPTLLLLRWLLFRVEFGAGLIKLRGDPCWRDLTCLDHHHETQPLPGRLSSSFHHLPARLHRIEVAANHVTQVVLPFLLFLPQPIAGIAAVTIAITQVWLLLSGNFAWLNALTIVLAASAVPDGWFGRVAEVAAGVPAPPASPRWFVVVVVLVAAAQVVMSWWPVQNLCSRNQRMNVTYNPVRLVGSYGAFGSVTRERVELVIEGTLDPDPDDDSDWLEYGFRAKPGDPRRPPPQCAPYHLRLDWLLWFAAMSAVPTAEHPWFATLLDRLLAADPAILRLLGHDPFDGARPTAVRVLRYRYRFTEPGRRRASGRWWDREPTGQVTGLLVR